ncbi:MAG: hypothetical protein JO092_04265 [Candidatus Eremiobacteraeota bacterium]|nr:hypothetical protein [Candidatus Eremiobacteraeota bacterium]
MRMRHFPWLRFHMAGTGQYERGREYSVTFTQRPSFAKGFENVDLSAFDPSMWSRYYTVQYTGSQGGASSFVLRPLRDDAQQANPLRQALVSLDSQYATRSVELQYASGDIDLEVTPARIGPYRLPITSDVTINLPGHDLSAHAEFSNYALTPQTQHAGGVAMRNWNQCLTAPVVAGSLNQAPKL